jgi:hypothetical protein
MYVSQEAREHEIARVRASLIVQMRARRKKYFNFAQGDRENLVNVVEYSPHSHKNASDFAVSSPF